jgi:LPXTG-motif cell wall-anchored protein
MMPVKRTLVVASRIAALVTAFLLTGLIGAVSAFAQYPPKVEDTVVGPQPAAQPGAEVAGEGLAFTGSELTLLFVALGILILAGALALVAGRRRAARTAA